MEVLKVGGLNANATKNGGNFEMNLINDSLSGIDCNDFMVIVNGIGNELEILKSRKKKIFVITDSFAFKSNKEILQSADVVLHQSSRELSFIKQKQSFSFIPFLFFSEIKKPVNQMNSVLFGGANTNRNEKIEKFLFDENGLMNEKVLCLIKKYDSGNVLYDDRIEYETFCKMMKYFKYTICFSRKEYDELSWVTPRFVEAVSNYALPVVDEPYTVYGDLQKYKITVDSYDDMIRIMSSMSEDCRLMMLSNMQNVIKQYKTQFKNLIYKIIS